VALLLLVPARRVALDTHGPATAAVLLALGLLALGAGALFQGKSGWCAGLCPVHPVERLYGQRPLFSVTNACCTSCTRCTVPCPDATPGQHPLSRSVGCSDRLADLVLVGGFPGFVFGWFQVPDAAVPSLEGAIHAFALPFGGLAASLVVFLAARALLPKERERSLVRAFGAAALACYYWFRVPALVGFPVFPGDGVLVDLHVALPAWFPAAAHVATTSLVGAWLLAPTVRRRAWCAPARA
jgi:hypothetical protein